MCKKNRTLIKTGKIARGFIVAIYAAFVLVSCKDPVQPAPPDPPVPEDPVLHVSVPGAYGVKGGDKIQLPYTQTSVLTYGNSFTYRILDPATLTVVSLSGLPVGLEVGKRISLHYRLMKGGRTLVSEVYENVEILLINDQMAWLKKNDEIFFVIQLI